MAKRVYFHFDFRANAVKKHSLTEEFKSAFRKSIVQVLRLR